MKNILIAPFLVVLALLATPLKAEASPMNMVVSQVTTAMIQPTAVEYNVQLSLIEVVQLSAIGAGATGNIRPYDVTLTLPYRLEAIHDTVLQIAFIISVHNKVTSEVLGHAMVQAPQGINGLWEGNPEVGIYLPYGTAREDIGDLIVTTWFRTMDSVGRWQSYQPTTVNDPNYRWLQVNPGSVTTINTPLLPLIGG